MVEYRIDPPLDDAALNAFFSRAWDDHAPREFAPVLAHSLGVVAAFVSDRLVGFVNLATDGGEHAFLLDPTVDVAHRRRGIGTEIAHAVWTRLPGEWEVRVMDSNHAAHQFWDRAINKFAGKTIPCLRVERGRKCWLLFSFESKPRI